MKEQENNLKEIYYGEEKFKQKQIQENIKNAKKESQMQLALERRLGSSEEAKKAMNSTLETAISYGIHDAESIAALHKMANGIGENGESVPPVRIEQAISALKLSENYNKGADTNFIGDKRRKDLNASLKERFMKKTKDENEAEQFATNTMQLMDRINKERFRKIP